MFDNEDGKTMQYIRRKNIFLGVREMQDHIFVLLMQTGTSVAKVLHFFTRKPYNHASVALDLTLEEMYSFCRNHIHFPIRKLSARAR